VSDLENGPAGWRGKARSNRVWCAGTVAGKIFEPRPVSPPRSGVVLDFRSVYIGRRVLACFDSRRVVRFESKYAFKENNVS
jgi:hypothetical protein